MLAGYEVFCFITNFTTERRRKKDNIFFRGTADLRARLLAIFIFSYFWLPSGANSLTLLSIFTQFPRA